ncbi:ATP-binding protein [Streptomyces sp. NPDC020412]|uniref:ATP-binding protein n=1 Tax=Streptomyces sp. NPDC020412 TaxID=3365073 RepID=UPI0037A8136B
MAALTRGLLKAAPVVHAFEVAFEPDPPRVEHMRRITGAALRHWRLAAVVAEAVLVVSELVTNAMKHGEGTVRLRVEHRTCQLHIAVTDNSPTRPVLRQAGDDEEGGRGLLLVDAFAEKWGTTSDGRTVWCTLVIPPDGTR